MTTAAGLLEDRDAVHRRVQDGYTPGDGWQRAPGVTIDSHGNWHSKDDGKFIEKGWPLDDLADLIDTYGEIVDEWTPLSHTNSLIAAHESGDISVSFEDDDGNPELWGDFTPSSAREVSRLVLDAEQKATADDRGEPSENGLIDWQITGPTLVGYNADGEVVIGWQGEDADPDGLDLDGWDTVTLSSDEAQDFADFLNQAADVAEEEAGTPAERRGYYTLDELRAMSRMAGVVDRHGNLHSPIDGKFIPKLAAIAAAVIGRKPVTVRPELADLKTTEEVQTRLRINLRSTLGRSIDVDLGNTHPKTAKEYAEGLLRAAERWPATRLDAVRVGKVDGKGFGRVDVEPRSRRVQITLAEDTSTNRTQALRRLRRGAAAGRPGNDFSYVAASLFGSAVDAMTGAAGHKGAERAVKQYLADADLDVSDSRQVEAGIKAQLGDVALKSPAAMVSEALADDALHGSGASPLARLVRAQVADAYSRTLDPLRPQVVKVPRTEPVPRPEPPMAVKQTGRKLTRLEKAAEMVAAGRYSVDTIVRLLRASAPREQFHPDAALAFARAVVAAGDVTQIALTGDKDAVRRYLRRQNTSVLRGMAKVFQVRAGERLSHRELVERLVPAVMDAPPPQRAAIPTATPDMQWLVDAYLEWIAAEEV